MTPRTSSERAKASGSGSSSPARWTLATFDRLFRVDWSGPLTEGPPSLLQQFNRVVRDIYIPALRRQLEHESELWRHFRGPA